MLTTHMTMNSLVNAHAALGMQVRAGDTGEWREVRGDRTTGSIVQLTTVYYPTVIPNMGLLAHTAVAALS